MWSAYHGWLSMPLIAIRQHGVATYEDWPMFQFELLKGRIEQATPGSDFDLFSTADATFSPGQTVRVPTGVVTKFDMGLRAIIKERSGMALNKHMRVGGGVIDGDYPDEWGVIMQWLPPYGTVGGYTIPAGTKVAQFKLEEKVLEDRVKMLGEGIVRVGGQRTGGFGSTDSKSGPPKTGS